MSLSIADIQKLARLARLELSAEEAAGLAPQFQQMLTFVQQLNQLDTEGVEPMTTALDVVNRWQADEPAAGLSREDVLRCAAASDGEYFLVPPVLGPTSGSHDS